MEDQTSRILHPEDFCAAPSQSRTPPRARVALLAGVPILYFLFRLSEANYLLYHSAIELLGVVVAATVFSIGWNTRRFARSDMLLVLAVAYLVVGALDVLHVLAYQGMGIFPRPGANLGTQFWIAARYVESASLLLGALLLGRRSGLRPGAVLLAYLLGGIVLVGFILAGWFPDCYAEGAGLTAFKIASEYAICGLLALAGVIFWRARAVLDGVILTLVLASIVATILSELSFTLYVDVYGFFNFSGHVLKLVSVVLLYRALVLGSLKTPYRSLFRDLARSGEALRVELEERQRAEERAAAARNAAEAADRAKGEFLANMSHEIRTPMNGIIGMTALALETDLSREQREHLQMVKTSADALLVVINDILDFSKIEADKLDLEDIGFDLRAAVERATESLALQAHEKGLELICQIRPEVPRVVMGDPGRLRQILVNLIGNAIKFTEKGEVVVRVEPAGDSPADANAPRLVFAVADTGIGISPDNLDRVFESFGQVDASIHRRHTGTGLGLAISRRLVERMGGSIWAQSEEGVGSTFFFRLTFHPPDAPEPAAPEIPVEVQGVKTLVVDDNATNRALLREMLANWGMDAAFAAGGAEAVGILRAAQRTERPFRLALLDSHMPDMDGFAVAEEIRADASLQDTAMLMVTSDDMRGDARRCRELGIPVYVVKPVKQNELLEAIIRTLAVATNRPTAPVGARILKDPLKQAEPPGLPSQAPAHVLLAEDNEINQALTEALLRKRGWTVTSVQDGRMALEVLRTGTFDVVLMDVQMPAMDGLEATRLLRERESGGDRRVPVVGLTAHAMKGDRERCLTAGMDDYLSKPVDPEELYGVVSRWVDLSRQARPSPADLSKVLAATNHDHGLVGGLVRTFLEECPRYREGLRECVAKRDAENLERTAHRFRGSAIIFGARALCELTHKLEGLGELACLDEAHEVLHRWEAELDAVAAWLTRLPEVTEG
ncbi:MAG: MASE3 domain-containing protein [Deferrisomatales bacterium]|nr:MASE3 domain-containing protein [Deferrisomatales bacterium]